MYGRWYTVKYGEGDRRHYIKLHAIVTADADLPFFIYAKVTDDTASDTAELEEMISNVDVNVGEMYLDKGYLSRANAQLIADIGAVPYFEWVQNLEREHWELSEVNQKLENKLVKAFKDIYDYSQKKSLSYRMSALALAVERVVNAMKLTGWR